MAPDDETRLPHYAYAAASAVRSLHRCLWSWSRQERARVLLAALDALPVLPDGAEYVPGGVDWVDLLPELERTDAYADAFNAALMESEIIVLEQRRRRKRMRARRRGL